MEGSKRKKDFESLWAERFANAEVEPAEHVWNNISGALANGEVGTYKKRLVYYKWAAAASLLLAFALGALYYSQSTPGTIEKAVAENKTTTSTENNELNDLSPSNNSNDLILNSDEHLAQESNERLPTDETVTNTPSTMEVAVVDQNDEQQPGDSESIVLLSADNEGEPSTTLNRSDDNLIAMSSETVDSESIAVIDEESEEELGSFIITLKSLEENSIMALTTLPEQIYNVPIYANAIEENEEGNARQGLWAGVNLGSGNFDPNYGAPRGNLDEALAVAEDFAPALDANTAGLPLQEESRPGPTIEVGIDVGKPVGEKWVLQSGLRFGRYTVNSATNLVLSSADGRTVPLSFQNREGLFSAEELVVSNEAVEVDNNFQLLSVPFKAGFLLLDKKFNILLNAGMSGDIYLGNQLNSNSSRVDDFQIEPGAGSPYRRVHLNGLTSIQLGYQLRENYFLSLEPSYRRALTDFAKSGNNFSSRPSNLGSMIGFRYLFQ